MIHNLGIKSHFLLDKSNTQDLLRIAIYAKFLAYENTSEKSFWRLGFHTKDNPDSVSEEENTSPVNKRTSLVYLTTHPSVSQAMTS